MKQDPDLRSIPVVVLTSSDGAQDVMQAYDLHANAFVTKPADSAQLARAIQAIEDFWFELVQLPSRNR